MSETTKPQGRTAKRPRWAWDVAIVMFFLPLAFALCYRLVSYLSGLTNMGMEEGIPFGSLPIFACVAFFCLACIAGMILRIVFQWKESGPRLRFLRVAGTSLMFSALVWAWYFAPPGIVRFAQGFRVTIEKDADIPAIRAWYARSDLAPNESVHTDLWPDCVKELHPRYVYAMESGQGIKLSWGGGFMGHYGLVVGPETLPTPQSDRSEYIIPLTRGAYLFFPGG